MHDVDDADVEPDAANDRRQRPKEWLEPAVSLSVK
jgi:hypothetical protein